MAQQIDTATAPKPFSNYAQGMIVEPGRRMVFLAGQVGADLSGKVPEDPEKQHRQAWQNVLALLAAAGMDHSHVVDVHIYITDGAHLGLCRRIRDEALKGHRAAATVVVVAGLAAAEMVVEVTVVAASPR